MVFYIEQSLVITLVKSIPILTWDKRWLRTDPWAFISTSASSSPPSWNSIHNYNIYQQSNKGGILTQVRWVTLPRTGHQNRFPHCFRLTLASVVTRAAKSEFPILKRSNKTNVKFDSYFINSCRCGRGRSGGNHQVWWRAEKIEHYNRFGYFSLDLA